ncbi:MAG: hypothetical protein HOY78_47975, partial [Saccharothrix sp.]|nr:hypothetical protein [Saccharothrix sp.]
IVRAAAPNGGVVCAPAQTPPGGGQAAPPKNQGSQPLAYTNAAYKTVPIFWTGTALLLLGVVVVAAIPPSRNRPRPERATTRSPGPRQPA